MDKLALIATTRTKPGKRGEVFELYRKHLVPRAEASGAQEMNDPDVFHLFELYGDPSAMQANAQAEWFMAYLQEVGPLLDGQPQVAMAAPRWAKGASI